MAQFEAALGRWLPKDVEAAPPHPSLRVIPRFYFGRPAGRVEDPLHEKLRQVVREEHLQRKTTEAVENPELEMLWNKLQSFSTETDNQARQNWAPDCLATCA